MSLLSLVVAVGLLAGNAFFVGAEFALISARRDRVEPLVAAGDRRARVVLAAIGHLSPMLAAAQLGITLCSLGLGAVAEPAVSHLIEGALRGLGVPSGLHHPIGLAVALLIVVSLHMVLGEMVPKNLSLAGPERAALWLGPPLVNFAKATRPVILFLNAFANGCLRLLGISTTDELNTAYTPGELAAMIAESRDEGLLEDSEHELLTSALGLSASDARSVMIPLADVVTVPWTITAAQLEDVVTRTGFSRFPVRPGPSTGDDTGAVVGFVHAKDVLGVPDADRNLPLPALRMRRMVEIRADEPLDIVLRTMQREGSHLARVVDGSPHAGAPTVGVIALEDVVEEFVGEVQDASHRVQ